MKIKEIESVKKEERKLLEAQERYRKKIAPREWAIKVNDTLTIFGRGRKCLENIRETVQKMGVYTPDMIVRVGVKTYKI